MKRVIVFHRGSVRLRRVIYTDKAAEFGPFIRYEPLPRTWQPA